MIGPREKRCERTAGAVVCLMSRAGRRCLTGYRENFVRQPWAFSGPTVLGARGSSPSSIQGRSRVDQRATWGRSVRAARRRSPTRSVVFRSVFGCFGGCFGCDGRAVECAGLENRYTLRGIKGSNPFPTAFDNRALQGHRHREVRLNRHPVSFNDGLPCSLTDATGLSSAETPAPAGPSNGRLENARATSRAKTATVRRRS